MFLDDEGAPDIVDVSSCKRCFVPSRPKTKPTRLAVIISKMLATAPTAQT